MSDRAYLVIATFCLSVTGYKKALMVLNINFDVGSESRSHRVTLLIAWVQFMWHHRVPSVVFMLTYIISAVLCLAVGVMLMYHLLSIASGVTSVEIHDHEEYRKQARARGEVSMACLSSSC